MNICRVKIIILIFFFLLSYLFLKAKPAYAVREHPYLFFTTSEIGNIQNRVNQGGPVKLAFDKMANTSWGDQTPPYYWVRDIIENSFHFRIGGNANSKQAAISSFVRYTTEPDRFDFQLDPQGKNYGVAIPCSSIALGYDFLYPDLSDRQKSDARSVLIDWGNGLYERYKNTPYEADHNFNTGSIGCLGLIGLTLEDEYSQAQTWVNFTKSALTNFYFNSSYNTGGEYVEGNFYQYYGSGPAILFAAAYEKTHSENLVRNKTISKMWEFVTYALMSDKKYPNYGDNGGTMINGENFYILQDNKKTGDLKIPGYLWTWNQIRGTGANQNDYVYNFKELDYLGMVLYYPQDVTASNPDNLSSFAESKIFPSLQGFTQGYTPNPGGMAVLRTGWMDTNNITLWLVNRWRWQNHQRYDPNHFLLSAFGEKLITSENYWTYDDPQRGNLNQHNTILINKDAWNGDCPTSDFVTGAASSLGKFTDFFTDGKADFISSDSRYPHVCFSSQNLPNYYYGNATEANVTPIVQADRTIALLKQFSPQPYFVMLDEFNKNNSPQTYTWQAYIPKDAADIQGNGTTASPFYFRKNNTYMKMVFITPGTFSQTLLPSQEKRNDRALQVTQTGVTKGQFLTLLFPGKSGDNQNITINIVKENNPLVLTISNSGKNNLILYNETESLYTYDNITTDAKLLILDNSGNVISKYLIYKGKNLTISGKGILSSASPISKVADLSDDPSPTSTMTPASPTPSPEENPNKPAPTITRTQTPPVCQTCPSGKIEKAKGNANCDSTVNNDDYLLWEETYIKTVNNIFVSEEDKSKVDFDCQDTDSIHRIDLVDYEAWRRNAF
ncbi:hypothetical protein COY59_03980 [Candidatus Gottesmanbacteria bacterium CG_4_10_14_0_8_um_filter_37_24]|uniref:Heparinase II N-terminal domain-containing protein n=2 Tax=Candidatus Gottesmaniibacteriota TaxID=1752720 RepID=A0A2M7RQJ2_9BACT|nr:MAG: hypothetical protein AUJ73_01475 [Candidatus Gottesmanbacteria bacterium CG1_02_37_22]PIZ02583.1 MAG: hypothetical protein COY59_03980 [Candidatus Gottesmanbacteria bacterium CG_4_10_14_0_8_um_filter_37_24]